MRTNIVINDDLMRQAMQCSGNKTKKATVEEALKLLIEMKRQTAIRELRGQLHWEGDLGSMRMNG